MTNPRYIETMIAQAITMRDKAQPEKFKLILDRETIRCWPRSRRELEGHLICNITNTQLQEGFSIPEWWEMTRKALNIMKELHT